MRIGRRGAMHDVTPPSLSPLVLQLAPLGRNRISADLVRASTLSPFPFGDEPLSLALSPPPLAGVHANKSPIDCDDDRSLGGSRRALFGGYADNYLIETTHVYTNARGASAICVEWEEGSRGYRRRGELWPSDIDHGVRVGTPRRTARAALIPVGGVLRGRGGRRFGRSRRTALLVSVCRCGSTRRASATR